MKKTLIQRQEACINRMLESRTSAKRSAKNCNAAIAKFRADSVKAGYSDAEIRHQITDIRDMHNLVMNAE